MTYERREEILSKEVITTQEVAELMGINVCQASTIVQQIKRRTGDRIGIKGRLHVQDYLDFFGIVTPDRYSIRRCGEAVLYADTV